MHKVCLPDANHEFHPGQKMFVTGFGALQNDGEHLEGKSSHSDLIWSSKAFKEMRIMTKYVDCSCGLRLRQALSHLEDAYILSHL